MGSSQPMTPSAVDLVPCMPVTASFFRVEQSMTVRGIRADIRRFAWRQSLKARFEPDAHYLDYSIGPRSRGARLISASRQAAAPFGDVSFIPAGSSFEALCDPSEYHVVSLTFDRAAAAAILDNEGLPASLSACFDVRLPIMRQGLARLAEEMRDQGFARDVLIESIATMLVVDLSRHLQSRHEPEGPSRMADWRLRRLKDRIEAGLAGPLSIAALADECGISTRHLMRTFKSTVGVTISSYIADARIAHARRELAREDALIKVVAGNCGFQSAAAFSAAFRKATGLSPRGYREELLRGG